MQPNDPVISSNLPNANEAQFEPAQQLAALNAAILTDEVHPRRQRLPRNAITVMAELFQPRGMSEKHIGDLKRAIQSFGDVEPLTVMQVGKEAVLIDGHHRLAAYQQTEMVDVPVRYFDGSPAEAILEAGNANSRAKLPMSSQERQNYAWRLVLLAKHSKAKIAQAAGVSPAQVANMRAVRKTIGENAHDFPHWWQARRQAAGQADEMAEDDRDQWKQDMADDFADRLAKAFSTKLADRPEIAAMALNAYFGRRLPEVAGYLAAFLPDDDDDELTDF